MGTCILKEKMGLVAYETQCKHAQPRLNGRKKNK